MLNRTMVQGRLVADPEMRTTQNGVAVCSFRVAWSETYKEHEKKLFLACTAWRGLGEMIGKYFHKGKEIIVEGALETEEYTDKEGNKRTAYEVVADQVYFVESKAAKPSADVSVAPGYDGSPAFSNAGAGDFEEIVDDSDSLPF